MHTPPSPAWPICFGLETEVGISVLEDPEADVVEESIQLVRCATAHGIPNLWDYATEDPHVDARGFRARELLQDTDEADYFSQDSSRTLSWLEIKSDLVLRNGARLYNDHAHPEYSTPECATLAELIAQDKAGERILEECARLASKERGHTVRLYKNNTDFLGHSYGCHENYLIPRQTSFDRLVAGMTPFLVTRQIYTGAGKVGWEAEGKSLGSGYQLSQRADFFTELVSIDTMNRRPLVNTRDEPHADPEKFRRFHVILGDANMSEFSTWLKVGTTALVLEALGREAAPPDWQLADPLAAHQSISRDPTWGWKIQRADGKTLTAIDLQRLYLNWTERLVDRSHPEKVAVLVAWRETLEALERDPNELRDRLDWVAKRWLLDTFRAAEKLEWSDPWLQSLDLEYHHLKRDEGLYYALEESKEIQRVVHEADVIRAMQHPPLSTRAYVRGRCVQKFGSALQSAQWDKLALRHGNQIYRLDLSRAFAGGELEALMRAVDDSDSVPDFIARLKLSPVVS